MSVKKDFTQEMVGAIAQGAVRIIGQDLAGASIRKHEGADEGGDVETIIRVSAHEVDEEYSDEWTHGFVGDVLGRGHSTSLSAIMWRPTVA